MNHQTKFPPTHSGKTLEKIQQLPSCSKLLNRNLRFQQPVHIPCREARTNSK